jgi:predicted Rossmann fold flavoprotein
MKTCIVIGGGAAGFFCAVNAARLNPHLRVVIVERSNKLLTKVKVSGGGRCNVTNACANIEEILTHYPRGKHFIKKLFHAFFTKDTIDWFMQRGVLLKEEDNGRMFPVSDSSQTIVNCLLGEAKKYNVTVKTNAVIKNILCSKNGFELQLANQETLLADYMCIATGGIAKGLIVDWLQSMGHKIVSPVPSLFTFNLPKHAITKLMGVAVKNVRIKIQGTNFIQEGALLITHWGLSGPCVLSLSAMAAREVAANNWEFQIIINWIPTYTEVSLKESIKNFRSEKGAQKVYSRNPFNIPQRLWEFLLQVSNIGETQRWSDLQSKNENLLVKNLIAYNCKVEGKTRFKEEFVTAGGVHLSEIDVHTMMSKKLQNLFFAGEVIDVDAVTGGYNFQNAWSTGFVAAKAISGG